MPQIKTPKPLAGGIGAGIQHAGKQSITRVTSETQGPERRLRRQHLVRHVHRLGARAVFEFIDEIARVYGIAADVDRRLERYAGLDPATLVAVGGDKFAASPTRLVGGAA